MICLALSISLSGNIPSSRTIAEIAGSSFVWLFKASRQSIPKYGRDHELDNVAEIAISTSRLLCLTCLRNLKGLFMACKCLKATVLRELWFQFMLPRCLVLHEKHDGTSHLVARGSHHWDPTPMKQNDTCRKML